MRAGADSSHRALFYDRDVLLQLRECENRLSVQPPSGPLLAIISKSDVTYSLLPTSKRIRRPMCGSGCTELPQGVGQPGFLCVLVGVGAGAECVASTPL